MRYAHALLSLLFLCACPVNAQQVRGSLSSMARYIEMHPMARDTVDSLSTEVDANGRLTFEGRPVFCFGSTCTFYRPADVEHAVAMSQDLSVTGWGFGTEGLSATVFLRTRQDLAGDFTWPRYDDAFSAILAYAELAREHYRIRAGRQRALSGLGFYSFDGIDAQAAATSWLNLELYGGRSLARALEEPRHKALDAIENFIPDDNAWLFGGAAALHASNGMAASLRYQREIWSDRAALVSERASADFRSSIMGLVNVEGAADYDVAYNRLGKAHLTLRRQFLQNRLGVDATLRRYLPFFELWTIWGVFSPTAYHEAELKAAWHPTTNYDLSARVGVRNYEDTHAEVFVAPAEDQTLNFSIRGRATIHPSWDVGAEYRLERGYGAFLSSGEVTAGWTVQDRLHVGIYGTAFQQILEFRTGEAAVWGAGLTADYALNDALQVSAGGTFYQQGYQNRPSAVDWTQKRAWIGIVWEFGRDPGLASTAQ